MMGNINKQRLVSSDQKTTPKTWSLERLKQKLRSKRVPSSDSVPVPVPKFKLTKKEVKAINDIKKAVKVDQKRIKKENEEGSLLDKVKNSFKQFDYY